MACGFRRQQESGICGERNSRASWRSLFAVSVSHNDRAYRRVGKRDCRARPVYKPMSDYGNLVGSALSASFPFDDDFAPRDFQRACGDSYEADEEAFDLASRNGSGAFFGKLQEHNRRARGFDRSNSCSYAARNDLEHSRRACGSGIAVLRGLENGSCHAHSAARRRSFLYDDVFGLRTEVQTRRRIHEESQRYRRGVYKRNRSHKGFRKSENELREIRCRREGGCGLLYRVDEELSFRTERGNGDNSLDASRYTSDRLSALYERFSSGGDLHNGHNSLFRRYAADYNGVFLYRRHSSGKDDSRGSHGYSGEEGFKSSEKREGSSEGQFDRA